MSLDKSIENGKEHRKPYYGAKAVDKTCRNHGSCEHCAAGRMHKVLRQMPVDDVEAINSIVRFKERYRRGLNGK
jgi:hypothetical protein